MHPSLPGRVHWLSVNVVEGAENILATLSPEEQDAYLDQLEADLERQQRLADAESRQLDAELGRHYRARGVALAIQHASRPLGDVEEDQNLRQQYQTRARALPQAPAPARIAGPPTASGLRAQAPAYIAAPSRPAPASAPQQSTAPGQAERELRAQIAALQGQVQRLNTGQSTAHPAGPPAGVAPAAPTRPTGPGSGAAWAATASNPAVHHSDDRRPHTWTGRVDSRGRAPRVGHGQQQQQQQQQGSLAPARQAPYQQPGGPAWGEQAGTLSAVPRRVGYGSGTRRAVPRTSGHGPGTPRAVPSGGNPPPSSGDTRDEEMERMRRDLEVVTRERDHLQSRLAARDAELEAIRKELADAYSDGGVRVGSGEGLEDSP